MKDGFVFALFSPLSQVERGIQREFINSAILLYVVFTFDTPVTFTQHDLRKDFKEISDVSCNHRAKGQSFHALLKKYVHEGRSND